MKWRGSNDETRRLMIMCPVEHRSIFTGLEMDERTWATITLEANSIGCPLCGQMHRWSKQDAFFDEPSDS